MKKSEAAILVAQRTPLQFLELGIPSLQPGQVLVKMVYSGLCQTQINEIMGYKGEDPFLPHTLGHEGSGIVEEVGEGVTKVAPKDRVVLSWIKGVGMNVPSCQYDSMMGKVNSGAVSTFLTYAVVSENRCIPIPKEMPLREAALFGCAFPTGAGVVRHEMKVNKGNSLAIFGVGGIGLSALTYARLMGADPIIAIDVHEHKLSHAKSCGATHTIHMSEENVQKRVKELTNNKGVDFALESAGKKEAMELAFNSLKTPGHCVLAGNLPKGERIEIDPFDLILGKQISGSFGGASQIDEDVALYCDLYLQGKLDLSLLITHEYPFLQINELIEEFQAGKVARGVVVF